MPALTTRRSSSVLVVVLVLSLLATVPGALMGPARAAGADGAKDIASGFLFYKLPQPKPVCLGLAFNVQPSNAYDRNDCGFGQFTLTGEHEAADIHVDLLHNGTKFHEEPVTDRGGGLWRFEIYPDDGDDAWPAGEIRARVMVEGQGSAGAAIFRHNYLGATIDVGAGDYGPGDDIPVTGSLFEVDSIAAGNDEHRPVDETAQFHLRVVLPDGSVSPTYGPFNTDAAGDFSETVPGSATEDVTAGPATDFVTTVSIEVIDTSYTDPDTGAWASRRAAAAPADIQVPADSLILTNSFVSSVGWVKPGETYPFRVIVENPLDTDATNAAVSIVAPDGTTFTQASPVGTAGSAIISGDTIEWTVGTVGAGETKTLVVGGRADTLQADPRIVWKDLSSRAVLTYDQLTGSLSSRSHGPKVIPPDATYETARFGDRPFPVVPVDYFDRKHGSDHSGELLANKINSPQIEGSTFNLFQEMSYGQLYPNGTVPSAGVATRGFDGFDNSKFTTPQPQGTCHGTTFGDAAGTGLYDERIRDGWYQLPGTTDYYGDDRYGTALAGAVLGVGAIFQIDDACGPTGKAVYDAAAIADPEIDYNDYDTDKDGVVDFFMMVFAGEGGNGVSQTSVPPYDNIWPHSSSLEFYYSSEEGDGYVSDDQLRNLRGRLLWWTDASRSEMTTDDSSGLPVYVRVGPYNVNPESAIEHASVISHEYGHSLGLPDFYSTGNRDTYGDWNLMATDKSQNMDVFSKQELGWIVPQVLKPGSTRTVKGWQDSKKDIHKIVWRQPNGDRYVLKGPRVHNGEAYVAKLPSRTIIDPKKVKEGASPDHVWWSESGNDFGCPPQKGHNFDIYLPELRNLDPATDEVKVRFKSYWDIEWDYDYGYVMWAHPGEQQVDYVAMESEKGYTTPASQNPNANSCQAKYGNGITGTSGSYERGTEGIDRVAGNYPDGPFLEDEYDLSEAAGEETVLRFSYATDPGLARPGWFIDNLEITVNGEPIYSSKFEKGADEERVYNGGCQEDLTTARRCTKGWSYISASGGSPADHAYYMEMRDRSGFDFDGHGENDRDPISFAPGMLLTYTDESHGYGNAGTDDPPAQSPLDSQPQPGENSPNLNDAAFTAASGDSTYSDFGAGHTDNYEDPNSASGNWEFKYDCLSFTVRSMSGDGNGPEDIPPYDLRGSVRFKMGKGCGKFNYGFAGSGEKPPKPPKPPRENCSVTGTMGADVLRGSGKDEVICALGGDDTILGAGGNDTILGGRGKDAIRGGAGKDSIISGRGKDNVRAGAGQDDVNGRERNDVLIGGKGRDVLKGNQGLDSLRGGPRPDILQGGKGNDIVYGDKGADALRGGRGNDDLNGGPGRDSCRGGPGRNSKIQC